MIAAIILAASQTIAMIVIGRVFQGVAVSPFHTLSRFKFRVCIQYALKPNLLMMCKCHHLHCLSVLVATACEQMPYC